MGRVIVVTSGKGGVGKSTVVANLGIALSNLGKRVCVLDLDIGLNNLDVILGIESLVVYDIVDILEGKCRVKQALVEIPTIELFVLPSSKYLSSSMIKTESMLKIITSLRENFDYVLIDSPAGIDSGFKCAISIANESIVVATPHLSSIRDADKVISILSGANHLSTSVGVNRIRGDLVVAKEMISAKQVGDLLKTNVVGVIPESDEISLLSVFNSKSMKKAFDVLARNIVDETFDEFNYLSKYKGFFGRIRAKLKRNA